MRFAPSGASFALRLFAAVTFVASIAPLRAQTFYGSIVGTCPIRVGP